MWIILHKAKGLGNQPLQTLGFGDDLGGFHRNPYGVSHGYSTRNLIRTTGPMLFANGQLESNLGAWKIMGEPTCGSQR